MLLETERLVIRKAVEIDIEFLAEIQTNEKVQKYIGGVLDSYENTVAHIKRHPRNVDDFYIIQLKEGGISIGVVSFVPNSYLKEKEILISFMPEYWGNEYGPEALSVFKEFWLNSQNAERMFVTVMPENEYSVSMLKKEGFIFVEEYKEPFRPLQQVYKYERSHT